MKAKYPLLPTLYKLECDYCRHLTDNPVNTQSKFITKKDGVTVTDIIFEEVQNQRCFYGNTRDKYVSLEYCYKDGEPCKYLLITEAKGCKQ